MKAKLICPTEHNIDETEHNIDESQFKVGKTERLVHDHVLSRVNEALKENGHR